jgi:Asp-tRNA(Asn)/Glu-tRNA(Gln) amidotransferase A subunit family amidase
VTHGQDLGLRAQAAAIAAGALDAGELLEATLARIAERDGELNSTPVVFADQARAMLVEAPPGPLHGVPLTLKDMFTTPWRGAHGGTAHELLAAGPSGVFLRLRDAGAVIAGVAQQHELGMGTTGRASVWGPAHEVARVAPAARRAARRRRSRRGWSRARSAATRAAPRACPRPTAASSG